MEIQNNHKSLLDLPEYALRILLSYLDATTLYQLSQTCTYLRDCVEDQSLWKYIDARSPPNTTIKLLYCTERIHEKTTHIFITSKSSHGRIPIYFFAKIKPFKFLRILSLESQKLNGFGISLKDFPPSLEELSLKGTKLKMKDAMSIFQHSSTNLARLRVLILDSCNWLTCSFLISVAKYESLEIISVVNCPRIHLHTVPYLSVAKFGFKKLKVFDCRFTGIGAELLQTFSSKETIQKFYFQSFSCAQVDYKINFPNNSKMPMQAEGYLDLQIYDPSLTVYRGVTHLPDCGEKISDSVLYKDPYPECTCGHREIHPNCTCEPGSEVSEDNEVPILHVTKFICEKHLKNIINLPETFRDFCVSSQRDTSQVYQIANEEDSSDEDVACCTIGTTSKMVISESLDDPSRRQEIVIPGSSKKVKVREMNVFIVNPLLERQRHIANRQAENGQNNGIGVEIEVRQNNRNENRANENIQINIEAYCEHRQNERRVHVEGVRERAANENENNENKVNETYHNHSVETLNLPSTSRGILENCLNENTENTRMEIDRQQSESDHGTEETKRTDQTQKDCDTINEKEKSPEKGIHENLDEVKKHIPSSNSSKDFLAKEKSSSDESNTPSCSKSTSNESASDFSRRNRDQPSVGSDNKRQYRKRRNVFNQDTSSSDDGDDDRNESRKRNSKIRLIHKSLENASTSSSNRIVVEIENQSHDSSSRSQRNADANAEEDGSVRRRNPNVVVIKGRYLSRPPTRREVRNEPDAHRASGNPFHVFRFNRNADNSENTRRINIRHLFPWPLQRRLPEEQKVSLRCLSLRGYKKITDVSLYCLKHLNLELLDLTYTSVTKSGIEHFLMENPNCRIIHHNYCRCKPKSPF